MAEGRLEEIQREEARENIDSTEPHSGLLREVVEAFANQSAADSIDSTTGVMTRSAGEGAIAKRMQQES